VDKRVSLKQAIEKYIKNGVNIGISGFVNTRIPVAIIQEIIRKGAKNLTLSFQATSICAELLAGAMLLNPDHLSIKRVELAWWGYEVIGLAPLLRHLAAEGMIQFDDYTNYGMSARFKAAAMGLEFIPVRDHGGSDMERFNRGTMIKSPFSGKNTYWCRPVIRMWRSSMPQPQIFMGIAAYSARCVPAPNFSPAIRPSVFPVFCPEEFAGLIGSKI
jgi:glutaconate CoA-transferase subunit A